MKTNTILRSMYTNSFSIFTKAKDFYANVTEYETIFAIKKKTI